MKIPCSARYFAVVKSMADLRTVHAKIVDEKLDFIVI